MKSKFLFSLILIGVITISNNLNAQELSLQEIITGEPDLKKEEQNLEFQESFFEALKQEAINNNSKAIESLEKCYQLNSTSLAVEFELSKNYLALQQYFEAELFIDKALEKEPKNSFLLQHKVAIFKKQLNFKEAIKIQKQLNIVKPTYSDQLVLLYLQSQEYEKAAQLINEIEERALSTTRIKGYKRYLENRENAIKKGVKASEKAVKESDINELREQYNTSKEYKDLRQLLNEENIKLLFDLLYADSKEGLELYPTQPFLYYMNGLALNKLAKYKEAITVLTIGIDFVIDDDEMIANYYEQLSLAYGELKNNKKALEFKQKLDKLRQ